MSTENVTNRPRHKQLAEKFEIPMIIISLAVIPVLIIEHTATTATLAISAWIANVLIWLAFVVEYTLMMSVVPDRWEYTKRNWIDVVIIVLSPPIFVPEAMAGIRVLRSFRIFRLLRTARVARVTRISRFPRVLAFGGGAFRGIRRVFKKNSMHYVAGVTLLLVLSAGTTFFFVEDTHSLTDSIWWALATMTTAGYGNVVPQTLVGRGLSVVVMLLGSGFMAVVTANIAAWFVESDQGKKTETLRTEIRSVQEEIALLRESIEKIGSNSEKSNDITGKD